MLNLSLLRHADSDWNYNEIDDMSRKINSAGVKKTKKIIDSLKKKEKKIVFEAVLCSPSVRTKETLKLFLNETLNFPEIVYLDELYYTSGKNIFDIVMLYAKRKRVLVVSHEPLLSNSIEEFFFASQNPHYVDAIRNYSTSALFNVSFRCRNWYEIEQSKAKINFYLKPKDF